MCDGFGLKVYDIYRDSPGFHCKMSSLNRSRRSKFSPSQHWLDSSNRAQWTVSAWTVYELVDKSWTEVNTLEFWSDHVVHSLDTRPAIQTFSSWSWMVDSGWILSRGIVNNRSQSFLKTSNQCIVIYLTLRYKIQTWPELPICANKSV